MNTKCRTYLQFADNILWLILRPIALFVVRAKKINGGKYTIFVSFSVLLEHMRVHKRKISYNNSRLRTPSVSEC